MKIIKILLAVAVAVIMAGCATTDTEQPVRTRNIFIKPSASMMLDCAITAPPEKTKFMAATQDERFAMLRDYNIKLLGDLKKCNQQWSGIREWMATTEQIQTKDNPK
jgi:hypothetical protein